MSDETPVVDEEEFSTDLVFDFAEPMTVETSYLGETLSRSFKKGTFRPKSEQDLRVAQVALEHHGADRADPQAPELVKAKAVKA